MSAEQQTVAEWFLIDTGADFTVLSAAALEKTGLPATKPTEDGGILGIGGKAGYVFVDAVVQFNVSGGGHVSVKATLPAFVDPTSSDISILGRDVLGKFDVIQSRRHDDVLLLSGEHSYHVTQSK